VHLLHDTALKIATSSSNCLWFCYMILYWSLKCFKLFVNLLHGIIVLITSHSSSCLCICYMILYWSPQVLQIVCEFVTWYYCIDHLPFFNLFVNLLHDIVLITSSFSNCLCICYIDIALITSSSQLFVNLLLHDIVLITSSSSYCLWICYMILFSLTPALQLFVNL
jgi:hypothetical protein